MDTASCERHPAAASLLQLFFCNRCVCPQTPQNLDYRGVGSTQLLLLGAAFQLWMTAPLKRPKPWKFYPRPKNTDMSFLLLEEENVRGKDKKRIWATCSGIKFKMPNHPGPHRSGRHPRNACWECEPQCLCLGNLFSPWLADFAEQNIQWQKHHSFLCSALHDGVH